MLLASLLLSAHPILVTLDHDKLSPAEQVIAQTLQGLVNRTQAKLWLKTPGVQTKILESLKREGWQIQEDGTVWQTLSRFRNQLKGVIEFKLNTPSLSVANGLCGPMQAIAVDESLVQEAKDHGFAITLDVRGQTEQQAFEKYKNLYKQGFVVEQSIDKPGMLRDFAVEHSAFTMDTHDRPFRREVVRHFGPATLVFGWGPDEYQWISDISSSGATGVAADWCINLSALEHLPTKSLKPPAEKRIELEDNVRYVAFVLSDGDNVQWQTSGFATDPKWYGSSVRGQFPMTWEVCPLLSKFAPRVLQYIYDHATPNDGFVCGAGLPGYMYPSVSPDRPILAKQTAPYLRSSGLTIGSFINQNNGDLSNVFPWLDLPECSAAIYKDYDPYEGRHGLLVWHNGKPCLSYRFSLWQDLHDVDEVANQIGEMPTDPKNSSASYALINVHAWSFAEKGGPIQAVKRVVDRLDRNTRIVTAGQLLDLLERAHPPH